MESLNTVQYALLMLSHLFGFSSGYFNILKVRFYSYLEKMHIDSGKYLLLKYGIMESGAGKSL